MASATGESGSPADRPHPIDEQYRPPAIEWEERFEPLADSMCPGGGGGGDCFRAPPEFMDY